MSVVKLRMKEHLWDELIRELHFRGNEELESGAFLLGDANAEEITHVLYYDDLDRNSLRPGHIILSNTAYVKLWEYCRLHEVRVLADVHTHPEAWTGQSIVDKANPMIPNAGHIALIIPCYSKRKKQKLRGVGMFEYMGSLKWKNRIRQKIFELIQ